MRVPSSTATASLSLLLMATVVLLSSWTLPVTANWYSEQTNSLVCPPCEGGSCDVDPASCKYGATWDHCQRRVCAKGPGGRCGGANSHLGVCADSLTCSCYRCTGCAGAPLECFSVNCRAAADAATATALFGTLSV